MKKFNIYIILLTGVFTITGCDNNFDEINTSTSRVNELPPVLLFNNAIQGNTFTEGSLTYDITIVQQMVTPVSGFTDGANYNTINTGNTVLQWNNFYNVVLKHLVDVINATEDDPEQSNLYNMARILKAYSFMPITDDYGDVPYFEAGKGYLEGIITPEYDAQRDIYLDILNELDEAGAALSTSNRIETGDALYNGDITKWKRFCYSLMLRAALRIADQENAIAQTYIAKAVEGGLMQSNEDNAIINNDFSYPNLIGRWLNGSESANFYIAKPFLDFLQATDDPRISSIAVRYIGATSAGDQSNAINGDSETVTISTDPEDQVGLPMGVDGTSISATAANLGLIGQFDFSQVDRTRMLATNSPTFLVTYAQTQLLLADAVLRGFTTGNVAALYSNGIEAHMQQLAEYGEDVAIPQSEIDAYLLANPIGANQLEDINNQYWVASFLNGPEAWANFRRSGYPNLTPNDYPGEISGDFINRIPYPDTELSVNKENMEEALSRQGFSGNNLDGHVWWDQ